jgi:hypothetical protein
VRLLWAAFWVGGSSLVCWLAVAWFAYADRRLWRDYHRRQLAELERRDRLGVHARRVTVAALPGERVALGFVHDDAPPLWTRLRTIRTRAVELVDSGGGRLALPAGEIVLVVDDLPGAEWRAATDQQESAYDLVVGPDSPLYVLAERDRAEPADPHRQALGPYRQGPDGPPLAKVPHDLVVANPWIPLAPTYALAADPRGFDVEVERRGGFRVWIVGLAITVAITSVAAYTGDAVSAAVVAAMILLLLFATQGWMSARPSLRYAPEEESRTWRAPVR